MRHGGAVDALALGRAQSPDLRLDAIERDDALQRLSGNLRGTGLGKIVEATSDM